MSRSVAGSGKLLDAVVGGWQVSGLYTITSGLPRSVANSGSWPTNWNYSGFASQIGPVPAPATTRNAPGIDGSAGPNIFANPTLARDGFDYSYAGDSLGTFLLCLDNWWIVIDRTRNG